MNEGLKIDDWLDDERDLLSDDLAAALAPRRPDPEAFAAGVQERIRRADGQEASAEADTEPLRMDRRPEPVLTGGLSRVAGLMPPMLLSKGASKAVLGAGTAAASKTGAKLTLKAVPALAAMPLFTLLMIAATFAYAIRGQLALTGDGVQRTDEAEAASAIRAWWVRNIVPTLIMSLLLLTAFAFDPSEFFEDGVVLLILAAALVAAAQLRGLSAVGLASRKQVGRQMGGLLMLVFSIALQSQQFLDVPGSASSAGALERVAPFLTVPAILLSALLCFALAKGSGRATRARVAWAVALWTVVIGFLGSLWAILGKYEATTDDVRRWVAEVTEAQLAEPSRWDAFGQALRLMDAAGEPMPDLSAFEAVVHEQAALEGKALNTLYLLPILLMDRALGSGFADDQALPEAVRAEIEDQTNQIEIPGRDSFESSDFDLIGLLGFRDVARFDEAVVSRTLRYREDLAERTAPYPVHQAGPRREEALQRIGKRFRPESFERTWRPILVAESPDVATIEAGGRSELATRIVGDLLALDRHGAVSNCLNAAVALEFLELSECVPSLTDRVHRALLDTWTLTRDGRMGVFKPRVEPDERDADGVAWEDSAYFGWIDGTATAVEAMARWGVPQKPVDGSRPEIDLLALERYLVETAHVWIRDSCSSFSVRAVGALSLLRTLPEFQDQLEEHAASDGPVDVLGRTPLPVAALLLSFLALFATLRAPVEDPWEASTEDASSGDA